MSAFAPGSAIFARRKLTQQALEAHYPGRVEMRGVMYDVQVAPGSQKYEADAEGSGARLIQSFVCSALKTQMPNQPGRGQALIFGGLEYVVTDVEGQSPNEPAWVIHAARLPKRPGA